MVKGGRNILCGLLKHLIEIKKISIDGEISLTAVGSALVGGNTKDLMEKVYMPMGFERVIGEGEKYGRMKGKIKKIIELCDEKYKK